MAELLNIIENAENEATTELAGASHEEAKEAGAFKGFLGRLGTVNPLSYAVIIVFLCVGALVGGSAEEPDETLGKALVGIAFVFFVLFVIAKGMHLAGVNV